MFQSWKVPGTCPWRALQLRSQPRPGSVERQGPRGPAQPGQGGGDLWETGATRAGRVPPPVAPVCLPCEPLPENASKGAVGLDHDEPPCPSESTLCLPRVSPRTALPPDLPPELSRETEEVRGGGQTLTQSPHIQDCARPGTWDVTSPLLNHGRGATNTPILEMEDPRPRDVS